MVTRIDEWLGVLCSSRDERRSPWLVRLWIGGLFLAGLAGWSYLLGWGQARLDFHDWADINVPRLLFLQHALRAGEWPLHMADPASLHGVTDRFLTLPDVITTPQTLLLLVLPVQAFILVDVLLHYAAGFIGVLLLRRHFQWSLLTFAGVFLLVLFNGHILAHYSVGHFTWAAYLLFPFVCLLILRFLDGDDSWRSIALFAALMFYMVLAGGQHHVTWVLLLLGLLLPFCLGRAWWLASVAAASGLLSAVRLLPPALELQSFRNAGLISDVIGYPSLSHLIASMVWLRRETPAFNEALPGNIWFFDSAYYEFAAYVGAAGFALIVYGAWQWLRDRPRYRELIVPLFVMCAFSIGSVYRVVRAVHIPLFDSERYTSRMFSLPMTFLIVLAAIAIDRRIRESAAGVWQRALMVFAMLLVAIDIAGSVRLWRVAISSGLFASSGVGATPPIVDAGLVHRPDGIYVTTVVAGLAMTILTAGVLIFMVRRERLRGTSGG